MSSFVFLQPGFLEKWMLVLLCFVLPCFGTWAVFTQLSNVLPALSDGWYSFADYDNDGDQDVFTTGRFIENDEYHNTCMLYKNMGNWVFQDSGIRFGSFNYGQAAWGDINNDGWLDIAVSGRQTPAGYADTTMVYLNYQGENFIPMPQLLAGTFTSNQAWADLDNDFDQDLLMIGMGGNSGGSADTCIYYNDGSGNLIYDNAYALMNIGGFHLAYLDVQDADKNGWLDIALSGTKWSGTGSPFSVAYLRVPSGGYHDIFETYPGGGAGIKWFDSDMDGDLDLAVSGNAYPTGLDFTSLYQNVGFPVFEPVTSGLPAAENGDIAVADYDNDGDNDLVLSSGYSDYNDWTKLLDNDGTGVFSESPWLFEGSYINRIHWVDIDNDNDLDLVYNGGRISVHRYFYRNDTLNGNTAPTPPQLSYSETAGFIIQNAADNETPANCLSFDLRIGTTPGGTEIMHPAADLQTGYRRISAPGRSSFNGYRLPNGTYYAAAQAIDGAFRGSVWSDEITIQIGVENSDLVGQVPALQLSASPNPASENVKIGFALPAASQIKLNLYNLKGQLVAALSDEPCQKGEQSITWNLCGKNGRKLAAGVYLLRLESCGQSTIRKLAIVN